MNFAPPKPPIFNPVAYPPFLPPRGDCCDSQGFPLDRPLFGDVCKDCQKSRYPGKESKQERALLKRFYTLQADTSVTLTNITILAQEMGVSGMAVRRRLRAAGK